MDPRVVELIAAIHRHSGAMDWNLEHACQELKLCVSTAYAAWLFKRETGMGIREYVNQQRLLMAVERLTARELPIKVIATELGYRQASNFTRFFKKQQLLNPTRFRAHGS